MFDREGLDAAFREFGRLQQAVSERGVPLGSVRARLVELLWEIKRLMPEGNDQIWDQAGMWMQQGWVESTQRTGFGEETEEWRLLIEEIVKIRQ